MAVIENIGLRGDVPYVAVYFSARKEEYIAEIVDKEDLTQISRRLDVSMGEMMRMVKLFAVFMVLMCLLSKVIIILNAQSISPVKILGYTNAEISRFYIAATAIVVMILLLLSFPVTRYCQMLFMGAGTYGVVMVLEYRRVSRIRMDSFNFFWCANFSGCLSLLAVILKRVKFCKLSEIC